MSRKLLLPIAFALCASAWVPARAQTVPLNGTVIGTELSWDYTKAAPSTTVNTRNSVFDGDYNSFFSTSERSYTWVGLDLGSKHVITKVAYSPRKGYASRMQLGVFEGANNPDFTDAVPIYMITDVPTEGKMTEKYTRGTRGFRYVRYVTPYNARCNAAEIRFYGRQSAGSDNRFYEPTNLPLVVIHTDGAKEITSRTEYTPGIISIVSADGREIFSDSLDIRGRGNGSWVFPKKPYKIKLANKARLLGMPAKAKKWTLINNYGDKTLVRNLLAFKISELMGMEYTPAGRLVDVMFNGEYKGTYQLCDQVEVKKGRVDITEMSPDDNDYPEITGGYLVEIDAYASGEKKWFTASSYSLPVSLKYPDEDDITNAQFEYIQTAFNRMAGRVSSPNFNNPLFGFRRYLDEDSFLKRFMVNELAANVDALWSVHMYKDRDSTRFKTGPVWDFDLAFDNDIRVHPVPAYSSDDFLFKSGNTTSAGDMRGFTSRIIGVEGDRMRRLWNDARYNRGLTLEALNAFLDSMQTEVYESQKLNFTRWPIMNQIVNQNYQITGSYEGEMKVVRDFLAYRLAWMDSKIGLTPVGIERTKAGKATTPEAVPAEGGISVSGATEGAIVEVYDLAGARVARTAVGAGGDAFVGLGKGIYVVRITRGRETITNNKVAVE